MINKRALCTQLSKITLNEQNAPIKSVAECLIKNHILSENAQSEGIAKYMLCKWKQTEGGVAIYF